MLYPPYYDITNNIYWICAGFCPKLKNEIQKKEFLAAHRSPAPEKQLSAKQTRRMIT